MTSEEILEIVSSTPVAYQSKLLPHPYDGQLSQVINEFCRLPKTEQQDLVACFDRRARASLYSFASRMASLAVNESSSTPIYEALIALGLSINLDDWDSAVVAGRVTLTMLYHAATALHVDMHALINQASAYIDQNVTKYMSEFLSNPLALVDMKIIHVNDPKGFRYKLAW